MPQEKPNLNKIWNAGKLFEPKPEQSPKPTPDSAENTPSNVKHKKSVIGAFMDKQEDPFKEKVEAVLKEIEKTEPASAPAMADEKENPSQPDTETIIGTGQQYIGKDLDTGKSIQVKGDVGNYAGYEMSGGEIHVEGNAWGWLGVSMSGGKIHIKGEAGTCVGHSMSGGEIRIEGNAGDVAGCSMSDGEIHVKGGAGDRTGNCMSGGTLRIDGDVASFSRTAFSPNNKGTIIWRGETIWERGAFTEIGKELYGRRYNPFAKQRIRMESLF